MAHQSLTSNISTTIAIVGSSFSGSLVAANLLKTATRPLIIELMLRASAEIYNDFLQCTFDDCDRSFIPGAFSPAAILFR